VGQVTLRNLAITGVSGNAYYSNFQFNIPDGFFTSVYAIVATVMNSGGLMGVQIASVALSERRVSGAVFNSRSATYSPVINVMMEGI